jgi:CHAD domain-containing protein
LEKLSDLFSSNKDDNEYHKARMVLKNLLYTYELFPEKLKKKLKPDNAYFDELQEVIGKWHDAAVALNHIGRISPASKPEVISRRERELFQAMTSLTKDFNIHSRTK